MSDFQQGDRVTLLRERKGLSCAYKGQHGSVSTVDGSRCGVLLDCGHLLDVAASGLAPSPYHRCINCRELKALKDLRIPSFWRGGYLCRKCWRELNIGHHQREFRKAKALEGKRKKPVRKVAVGPPARRRKRRKARKK